MIVVGLIGIAISFLLTYLVASLFIAPIQGIVKEAQDIAQEKREHQLEPRPKDEIGTLTEALNTMLDALKRKRQEIQEYANTLEGRVQERTFALVASEEKYRTLVENVPLIVYRILEDGTTEFINSTLTESLGYTIEEAVGDRTFWQEKICGTIDHVSKDIFEICFKRGEECRLERIVKDREGYQLTFIDHAIPAKDRKGNVKWVDGIMIDITELKKLQERTLRTEEIRVLGEISARMAHEIRNPLLTAGGFARRLHDSLPKEATSRKLAKIILDQVAKLESVLNILLSSIKPFDLSLSNVDVNSLLEKWVETLKGLLGTRRITVRKELSKELPHIRGDDERLDQAFENLLRHAIVSTPEGEGLELLTERTGDHIVVSFRHKVSRLSDDDLEKFFFPHIAEGGDTSILDLPLSKIIIHRHGGKIDLLREGENLLVTQIELPVGRVEETPEKF
jgi:PAS domain S-box-containing protein